ncbi:sensor histidine kinase [Streptomyces beijiangensis]|uniref:histidine kinase n=1 Tax=Streptomyces beijiangensis TaxID=163361 RepID=A0A939FGW3_9ACTN|nr:ATP-binding protein [Streptomyces beijiangensis]MBO0516870.1 HAMP domain-containing protein [Streptomyces beijiangensis]
MSSERVRLTALYGGLLVLAGAILTTLVYFLVRSGLGASISTAITTVPARAMPSGSATQVPLQSASPAQLIPGVSASKPPIALAMNRQLSEAAENATLHRLLTVSGIALACFAALSIALAWWMAGRVLRPVAVITTTARRLSGENLHERIALQAPPGELKELADTFDAMLGRIEQLVSAQQRFAANAAHELRTPLAVQRAAAEIGLADDPTPQRVAEIRTKLIQVADNSEHLIEELLLLAASDQGLQRSEPVALESTVSAVVAALADEAARADITVHTDLEPLSVQGDSVLLEHLVRNLLINAVRYNHQGGTVRIRTRPGTLEVSNTGPLIPTGSVDRLFEPFQRAQERRHAPGEGAGLGLSIVESIAQAHLATVTGRPNAGGGLTIQVRFSPVAEPDHA